MLSRFKYLIVLIFSSIIASCQTSQDKNSENTVLAVKENDLVETTSISYDTTQFHYSWKDTYDYKSALINNIPAPQGYNRTKVSNHSFAAWLRHLPLKEDKVVYLYNGEKKYNQSAQYSVVDISIGNKDLQQCADAVMRLRAEYLFATDNIPAIHFNYTNGVKISFDKWSKGYYPKLRGNKVDWVASSNNNSYTSFMKYMNNIFMYAGTASLEKELETIPLKDIKAGDVFIKGGFPGHAVIVMDVAIHETTGDKCFMLAQSYMPAQNIHILNNPNNSDLSPWYSVKECQNDVSTPEWTFSVNQLKRFPQ